jgi:hypothetical protein
MRLACVMLITQAMTTKVHTAVRWAARFTAVVSAALLVASVFFPWAESALGPLHVTFGVPGARTCLRQAADACCELDWEHIADLPWCMDALLTAAVQPICLGEAHACAEARAALRAQAGMAPGGRYPIRPARPELLPDLTWLAPLLAVAIVLTQLGTTRLHTALHLLTIATLIATAAVATSIVGAVLTSVDMGIALLWAATVVSFFSLLNRIK